MTQDFDQALASEHYEKSAHKIARASIVAMLTTAFLVGGCATYSGMHHVRVPPSLTVLSFLISLTLTYVWYYYDAIAYGYRRSRALNLGIIFLAVAFVPYYLARSRPKGRRLVAILWMLGFAACYILMELIGALLIRLAGAF